MTLTTEVRTALADRLDQLIGWAKSGKVSDRDGGEYYLMDTENVDQMRDGIIRIVEDTMTRGLENVQLGDRA